jgi:hypothetical protein
VRQEPEHFGEQELDLLYIAKKLKEALRLEEVLTGAGLDYLVETDTYKGGIVFQAERVGAFFYVAPADLIAARETMANAGMKAYEPAPD